MQALATVALHLTSLYSQRPRVHVTAHCEVNWSLSLTVWRQLVLMRSSQRPALSSASVQVWLI